jgi:DNA-binding FadR family transcriptional regulator
MSSVPDVADDDSWSVPAPRPRTTVDDVQTTLKNMIHRGELGPGDRLPPERQLCAKLQVSRSSLREALNALRADGYVEVRRGATGGTFITRLDEPYSRWLAWLRADSSRLRDIINVRTAVECQIAWLAAENQTAEDLQRLSATLSGGVEALTPREFREMDGRFHATLAELAGSARLTSLMIEGRGELFVPASSPLIDRQTMLRSQVQHEAILVAVRDGRPVDAVEAMRHHLQSTYVDVAFAIDGPDFK